jgi:tetraacyldisaccharide 4'-kinase
MDEREIPQGGGEASAEAVGDEPLLIARRCPQASVWVGPDRARLAARATAALRPDLILLDDGFQHWRLARDEDLVVVDEEAGFGNGRLLPRGPLREPLTALGRATWLWVNARSSTPATPPGPALPVPMLPKVVARRFASCLVEEGRESPVSSLEGERVLAFAGVARPNGFFRMLEGLGARPVARRRFADHHAFTDIELAELRNEAAREGAMLVTTEKDAMRLPAGFPARALRLEVELLEGKESLGPRLLGREA